MKRFAVVVLGMLLATSSCAAGGPGISGDLRSVGVVTVTFKVSPARVQVGQPVRVSFRLFNNAGRDEELSSPTSQRYDFWATRGGHEVWRWSDGRVFAQQVTHDQLGPQSSVTFAEPWTPERVGTYVIHGELKADGYRGALTGKLRVG